MSFKEKFEQIRSDLSRNLLTDKECADGIWESGFMAGARAALELAAEEIDNEPGISPVSTAGHIEFRARRDAAKKLRALQPAPDAQQGESK